MRGPEPTDQTLRQLHVHYVSGRYDRVVRLGESALERHGSPRWRGRIRYYLAMAYFQLGRPADGAPLLGEARRSAEDLGDPRMLVECMAAEAALAILRQAPNAVEVATDAIAACRRLTPVPKALEARLLTHLASAYLNAGQWSRALQASMDAMQRMEGTFELTRQAIVFDCMAFAHRELGQTDLAIEEVVRAIDLHASTHNTISLARSLNNLGLMLMDCGERDQAREHFERAVQLYESTGVEVGRASLVLSVGELSFAEGDLQRATDFARKALDFATRNGEGSSAAQSHVLLGQIAAALSQPDAVDAEFKTALDEFARCGAHGWLDHTRRLYARVRRSMNNRLT